MSVINQMLNGLEQRGIQVAAEQVRPVHVVRDTRTIRVLLAVALFVAVAAFVLLRHGAATPPAAIPVAEPKPALTGERVKKPLHRSSGVAPTPVQPEAVAKIHPKATAANQLPVPVSTLMPVTEQPAVQPIKQVSVVQQADAEFHKASASMQLGHNSEAMAGFEAALRLDPGHDAARQAQVVLLLENKRAAEAEQVLQDGLKHKPSHSGFAMLLARLQVERGALDQAIVTLESTLPHIGQQPEYQAFYAALLQRKGRHGEAVEHYQVALKAAPNKGLWLMGCGISLQALSRSNEAKVEYQHALDSQTLSSELQAFVQQKLKAL